MLRRVTVWAAWGLFGLVLLGWLWPLLFGQTLFWGLPALQFYPWRAYAFDVIRAGQFPLWNPFNGGGAPLLANYQTAVCYPPNWLHLLLPHVTAMNLLAVLHIVWAAAGMWGFAGAWRLPVFGRAVSMLSFALGGYLIARLGSFPTVAAAAWLPWLLWTVHGVVERPGRRTAAMVAGALALLLLSGHAQTAFYVLVGAAAYALWLGWARRDRWRGWLWLLLGGGLGVGLAAVQLLPTAQLLLRSSRSDGLHYEWVTNFSYSPVRALNLLAPNIFGTPADGSYFTEGAYFEDAAYIGLLPLLAAFFALLLWLRQRRDFPDHHVLHSVPFWAGTAALAFLLALGRNGPLFPLLYRVVPTFDAFQGPVRWLLLMVFPLSLLAGVGVSYAWGKGHWVIFWSRLTAAGGAGMAVIALVAAPYFLPEGMPELRTMAAAVAGFGLTLSACAVLTLLKPDSAQRQRLMLWQVVVLVFVAFDLFWAFRGVNPTVPAVFFRSFAVERAESGLLYMPEAMEQEIKFGQYFPLSDYRVAVGRWPEVRTSLLPNLNMLDAVPMVNNFEPMVTNAYASAVAVLETDADNESSLRVVESFPTAAPFGREAVQIGAGITALTGIVWGWFLRRGKPG